MVYPDNGPLINLEHAEEDVDKDDGLGYYSDGAKRTLTDEQVAIFRHSEIQSLLREKELQDNKERPEEMSRHGSNTDVEAEKEDEDEEGYARFLEAERKEMEAYSAQRKKDNDRKRTEIHSSRVPTERGLVRELDYVTDSNAFLDYGDEPLSRAELVTESNSQRHDLSIPENVVYSKTGGGSSAHINDTLAKHPEGRKIWWPTIGTSTFLGNVG
ncbi:hypothetical protein MMC20_005990 [Loxospora ochrophaea]|nr:hypothetical protein [Loxospora ochrophaea]